MEIDIEKKIKKNQSGLMLLGFRSRFDSPTFHVGFVVEVWHFPAILLLVVVVSVGGMVRRCDRFGVRSWCSVEEISLASRRIGNDTRCGCFSRPVSTAAGTGTDHPNQQDQKDQKYDES